MTYVMPSGRLLTLGTHSLEQWADAMRAALVHLGCSAEYAQREYELIAAAKPR